MRGLVVKRAGMACAAPHCPYWHFWSINHPQQLKRSPLCKRVGGALPMRQARISATFWKPLPAWRPRCGAGGFYRQFLFAVPVRRLHSQRDKYVSPLSAATPWRIAGTWTLRPGLFRTRDGMSIAKALQRRRGRRDGVYTAARVRSVYARGTGTANPTPNRMDRWAFEARTVSLTQTMTVKFTVIISGERQ
jgi:hypothetical protein